ncbi:hypothetical protein TNCV_4618871 [Trichonephila clavipes]|nr:hypothetical protein TNCV_4618871 [Trichonephila clavipes]
MIRCTQLPGNYSKFRTSYTYESYVEGRRNIVSPFATLHTSPSDAPISVTRSNNTRRFSLKNNCSRRGLLLHLTKLSIIRTQFLDDGTNISRLGLDLVSKVDGQAVETVIRGFSPWQPLRCETVRVEHGETRFSFSASVVVFPQVLPSACQVMMRSMLL